MKKEAVNIETEAFDTTGISTTWRNTIKVAAGHYFDLAKPTPESVDLYSIGVSLSKTCRYGGHTEEFYTVAEHLVRAADLAKEDGLPLPVQQAIFCHDFGEAYLGDVVKPLKLMLPEYHKFEREIDRCISSHFGVDLDGYHGDVKKYDYLMYRAEKDALFPGDTHEWSGMAEIPLRDVPFEFWGYREGRKRFFEKAEDLGL